MREHVKILLLGDEGVGKSSLISSYISRYLAQEVPAVMTDTIIPPGKTASNVRVTIMDTSARAAYREQLLQRILYADVILLLYDVTRSETFESIASEWLPMLKDIQETHIHNSRSYNQNSFNLPFTHSPNSSERNSSPILSSQTTHFKPVIMVGSKSDLVGDEVDRNTVLNNFPFVLLSMTCSAANLENVDDVFKFAEQFVTYPLHPIYDLTLHEFTPACRRALRRIFRIFDADNDNLLDDYELCELHLKCFDVEPISDGELKDMKQLISGRVTGGLLRNCFTFEGFLGLIEFFIVVQQDTKTPWSILRHCNYDDDDLNLQVPASVLEVSPLRPNQSTELSESASKFLLRLAKHAIKELDHPVNHQPELSSTSTGSNVVQPELFSSVTARSSSPADSSLEGESDESSDVDELSWDVLQSIFLTVLPPDYEHPWKTPPKVTLPMQAVLLSRFSHVGANVTLTSWLTQWNVLAMHDPAFTQDALYRLGYVNRSDLGVVPSSGTISYLARRKRESRWFLPRALSLFSSPSPPLPKRTCLKVCILGGDDVGKSSFVWNMSGLRAPGSFDGDVERGVEFSKSEDCILAGGYSSHELKQGRGHFNRPSQLRATQDLNNLEIPPTILVPQKKKANSSNSNSNPISEHDSSRSSSSSRILPVLSPEPQQPYGTGDESFGDLLSSPFYVYVSAIPFHFVSDWLMQQQLQRDSVDLFILMYQCGDESSGATALNLEKLLPPEAPRLFIGSKSDLTSAVVDSSAIEQKIDDHLRDSGLPPKRLLSSKTGAGILEAKESILMALQSPEQHTPIKGGHRRDKRNGGFPSIEVSISVLSILGISIGAVYYIRHPRLKDLFDEYILRPVRGFLNAEKPSKNGQIRSS